MLRSGPSTSALAPSGSARLEERRPCRVVQLQPSNPRSIMTLERCEVILRRLRNFVSKTRKHDFSDHPRSGEMLAGLADHLIRLADSFVHELQSAGCSGEMEERAERFRQLTNPGSDLDRARVAAFRAAFFPPGKMPSFRNM